MQRAQDRQTILTTELEFMLPGFKSKYKKNYTNQDSGLLV